MDEEAIKKLVEKIIEERLKQGLGQFDIAPQTIKERHLDWEEFNANSSSLNSSFIRTISSLVKTSNVYSASSTLANTEEYSVQLMITFPDYMRRFLGIWHFTFYESSVSQANIIPYGASVTSSDYRWFGSPAEYGVASAYDQGTPYYGRSTGSFWIQNQSGGAKDIIFQERIRYLGNTTT